ncbi:MAG: BolA family transcriptional regulator [Rhodobiaceae bacterium]|nr:BolA family transcriptional regulator [Rhodobiaceae bacterium]MCC0013771.1 BolA family transcriptional regulator [Rhodobiaceae bacterium]MCC0018607.1 BolA family transcriptional regulator [Rhodobiaceae bacterium]MCC0062201.1 BolA family transcriptional regulator [Rhodobiaceae bacterium]
MARVQDEIKKRLQDRFQPSELSVEDESHLHQGHSGWREGGETHFRVTIRSGAFNGKSRIDQHRMVNAALDDLMGNPVHALAIKAQPEA